MANLKAATQIAEADYKKVLVNAWTASANGAEATQYGSTIIVQVVGSAGGAAEPRKRARIANYKPTDQVSKAAIPLIKGTYPAPWHGFKIRQYSHDFDSTVHDYPTPTEAQVSQTF